MKKVTAFAPATVANLSVGFDILGLATSAAGDEVTVSRTDRPVVEIESVELAKGGATLPADPAKNTATAGLIRLIADRKLSFGFRVAIRKGIALGSGMGGSAASAVAAIVAANEFLGQNAALSQTELIEYAVTGEAVASGARHADNVAPCLLGGLTLVRALEPIDVVRIAYPEFLRCVLVHPGIAVHTREARAILKREIALSDHVRQSANLAGFLAGCYTKDRSLIARSLEDVLIEPQRAKLIPSFAGVKHAALGAGALGCGISGSGPAVFALVDSAKKGEAVLNAMTAAFKTGGISEADGWSCAIEPRGARVTGRE